MLCNASTCRSLFQSTARREAIQWVVINGDGVMGIGGSIFSLEPGLGQHGVRAGMAARRVSAADFSRSINGHAPEGTRSLTIFHNTCKILKILRHWLNVN